MSCQCCSCLVAVNPHPDPFCRQHGGGLNSRQCDLHGSPGARTAGFYAPLASVQVRLAGGEP